LGEDRLRADRRDRAARLSGRPTDASLGLDARLVHALRRRLWMSHSLLNWCQISCSARRQGRPFQLDDHAFAATVFFATLDPVAAVGLWLATPWGGVTWLVAVAHRFLRRDGCRIFSKTAILLMRPTALWRLLFRPDLRRQSRALWKLTIFTTQSVSLPKCW